MAAPTERIIEHADDRPTRSVRGVRQTPLSAEPEAAQLDGVARAVFAPSADVDISGWSAAYATAVVALLKDGADRHWLINPNQSLHLADAILRVGQLRDDRRLTALGMMARADALKYLGRTQEAWDAFQQAGDAYTAEDDEVGWARTRIGMLVLSTSVNAVESALAEAEQAHAIFLRHAEVDLLTRLDINLALVYSWIGDPQRSLTHGAAALRRSEAPGSPSHHFLGLIFTNSGSVHANLLGDYRTALDFFHNARAFAEERHDTKNVALAELDIAYVATQQGRYREALQLLRRARAVYEVQHLALDATHVDREMVECFLHLRRFDEARDLARQVVAHYRQCGEDYYQAHALLNLATALAELNEFAEVQQSLDAAERLFRSLHADSWATTARLRRGRLALRERDAETALREATAAEAYFAAAGVPMQCASASVVRAESLLLLDRPSEAADAARTALDAARTSGISLLRYFAHLALGRVAERDTVLARADRHYRAAIAAVDRVQQDLTITLRPGFLEDKGEAFRALVDLRLRSGHTVEAFTALEHAKSQAYMEYATNGQQLHWTDSSPATSALLDELATLRDKHHWLFTIVHGECDERDAKPPALPMEDALPQLAANERRMRSVTEQLYLHAGETHPRQRSASPRLCAMQAALPSDSVLVEFYYDETTLYGFVVDAQAITVKTLAATPTSVERLLAQLQLNIAATVRLDPHAAAARVLRAAALRLLEQLYTALLDPLTGSMAARRLYIVPYGMLHCLPFHLLRSQGHYLIQDHELVMLPAAGLLARTVPTRAAGARIVAHSANGSLPQVLSEARMVGEFFPSETLLEQDANRSAFAAPPTQILHIAAHAAYRVDQPDLSYIDLADGQLYADDLLQHDLSYELVTLSACETGRAQSAARDELIGLARGFLYAGAGALIASLWRVGDEIALPLMRQLYAALGAGASKAAALQLAQLAMLDAEPALHPALWGPFQLLGDARPLSSAPNAPRVSGDGGGLEA